MSFGGAVGGTSLTTVTVVSSATTSAQAVTTTGAQSYTAATLTTLNGTLLVNTAGSGVSFTGPGWCWGPRGRGDHADGQQRGEQRQLQRYLDGQRRAAFERTAGGGAVSFAAAVGGTTPLSTVTVSASATTSAQAVTSTGAQSYTAGTSTTMNGTLLVNTAGSGVSFTGPVVLGAGGGAITLTGSNAGNNVSFSGTSTVNGGQP